MKEIKGNFWGVGTIAAARCITTNGILNNRGQLIMGKGIALDAKIRYPGIDTRLGKLVKEKGNIPHICAQDGRTTIISFPTKNHWKDPSDINLIIQSATILVKLTDFYNWNTVILTRPGCGYGQLNWKDVKDVLNPLFNSRFFIYYN